jgi:hypothetical protein
LKGPKPIPHIAIKYGIGRPRWRKSPKFSSSKPEATVVIKPKATDTKIKVEFFMATIGIKEINIHKSIGSIIIIDK